MTGTAASSVPGQDGAEAPIFHALLTPHRSLSKRGFNTMMGVLAILSFFVGIGFVSNGAWPVIGFFGLDVLVLWLAFRANYRAGRVSEEVRVSRTELLIRKVSAQGRVAEASYNPFWTRLHVSRHEEIGVTRMEVTGKGRTTQVGGFLNPADRESFAVEFGRALATARKG